jgi:hypothetical protein
MDKVRDLISRREAQQDRPLLPPPTNLSATTSTTTETPTQKFGQGLETLLAGVSRTPQVNLTQRVNVKTEPNPSVGRDLAVFQEFQKYVNATWDSVVLQEFSEGKPPDQILLDWMSTQKRSATVFIAKMALCKGTNLIKYCGNSKVTSNTIARNSATYTKAAKTLGLKTKKTEKGKSMAAALTIMVPFLMDQRTKLEDYHGFETEMGRKRYSFQGSIAGMPLSKGLPELFDYCRWCMAYTKHAHEFIRQKNENQRLVVLNEEFWLSYLFGMLQYMPFSLYCWTNATKMAWMTGPWTEVSPISNKNIALWSNDVIGQMVLLIHSNQKSEWVQTFQHMPLF